MMDDAVQPGLFLFRVGNETRSSPANDTPVPHSGIAWYFRPDDIPAIIDFNATTRILPKNVDFLPFGCRMNIDLPFPVREG